MGLIENASTEQLLDALKTAAKALAEGDKTARITRFGVSAVYYPRSRIFRWFREGERNITRSISYNQAAAIVRASTGRGPHD